MEKDEREFPKPTLPHPFCSSEQCTVWPKTGELSESIANPAFPQVAVGHKYHKTLELKV